MIYLNTEKQMKIIGIDLNFINRWTIRFYQLLRHYILVIHFCFYLTI